MIKHQKIAFVGGGNMAQCLIQGLVKSGYPKTLIFVSTPHQEKVDLLKNKFGINGTTDNVAFVKDAEIVVLAVKPQVMAGVLNELNSKISDFSNKLIISIMAGVTINRIGSLLNGASRVIRVMPNTPALIGYGMAGIYASENATKDDKEYASELLGSVGKIVYVDSEQAIDAITAISGSAPAYFFYFMECLAKKAMAYNFSEKDARAIIEQVALGSAEMVLRNQDKTLEELRAAVTSKGGTTYEALKVFSEENLEETVSKALDACCKRANEMAKQF